MTGPDMAAAIARAVADSIAVATDGSVIMEAGEEIDYSGDEPRHYVEITDANDGKWTAEIRSGHLLPIETGQRVTFDGEAWEWFYGLIEHYTEKELAVVLDGFKCRLVRIEGDLWGNEPAAVLVVNEDVLGVEEKDARAETRIPMFTESGECAVTKMHLL